MSWFDRFFKRPPKNSKYAFSLDGWLPIYSQYGVDVYASDVVQQALKCIVDEMKKLNPTHVRYKNSDPIPIKGGIQNVLDDPNEFMTTSEFLEKTIWLLLLNYNAFIIPTYYVWTDEKTGEERRRYESLYPIKPIQVDFIEDITGKLFVKFYFSGGTNTTIAYDDVIHLKYNYSVNQYMGGDELGNPNIDSIKKTLSLNEQLLEGVAKAMKASYAVNGIVKYNTMMDDGKTEAALKDLEAKLKNNESGFLPLDIKTDFTPLERKTNIVDENTLKFIDEKILRNWGVPLPILTGDYTKEQYEAFYQKTLEPLIRSFSQAMTKKLFTRREKSFGNKIELYPEDLVFMTTSQKIQLVELLSPTGAIFENEKRTTFGLKPLPELEGQRFMSLNWINTNDASAYQVGNVNVDIVDETKESV